MRRKAALSLCVLLYWAALAHAAPKIRGAASYGQYEPIVLKAADVTSKAAQFLWDVSGSAKTVESGETLYVWAPPGEYVVRLTAIDFEAKKVERTSFSFTVRGPPGPPPDPGPGPGPGPTPQPVAKGFRVLVVYDSAAATALPAKQQSILYGKAFRDLLNQKTALGPDGKTREWRIYDKGVDASAEAKVWGEWLARPRASTPWLVIGGDSGVVYEGPLPPDVSSATALVLKYAPAQRRLRKAG